ncbi:kinase-like protein [Aspergillus pseudoustus]|uniref:EKC/KEOPS complex subunit BUD32 n=1 Tax=Aspergillus pseudoustus TaxID=1810923 RepID=A0ABR4JAQ8_9EURO
MRSMTGGPPQEPESRGIPRVITYRHVHIGPGDEPPILRYGEVIYKAKGKFLAREGTAFIELLPCGEVVVKTPTPDPFYPREEEDHRNHTRLETQVYQRIGPHASIPKLVSWDPVTFCLTLEYLAHGNLRDYVRSHTGTITPDLRWKWAWQAAQGPCVLHDADVIHCDISPRNFLLDTDLDLKISDFGGSSPYGSVPAAFASTRYRRPGYIWDDPPHVNDDIFGLGSLLYFIMTGMVPYEEVPSDEVVARYTRLEFPDVSHLSCGDIIQQCWNSKVDARQKGALSTRSLNTTN